MKLAVLLCLLMVTPAIAEQREGTVMFDGSLVTIIATGDHLEILYIEPPPILREVGVKKDTPIFTGDWEQGILVGEAYVYSPHCPTIAYPIRGVVNSFDELVVIGPTPKLREGSCEIEGYEWGERSTFKLGRPLTPRKVEEPKKRKAKPKPKPKPEPKAKPRQRPAAPQYPQYPQWPQQQYWRW